MPRGGSSNEPKAGDAVDLMLEKIDALPVVDPAGSRLVGMLSHVDVLRAARNEL